jgi:hypothetical protein
MQAVMTEAQSRIARAAYRDFGKGSGHFATLNFGICFACALAKVKGEPLLFKGSDFAQTDIRLSPRVSELDIFAAGEIGSIPTYVARLESMDGGLGGGSSPPRKFKSCAPGLRLSMKVRRSLSGARAGSGGLKSAS